MKRVGTRTHFAWLKEVGILRGGPSPREAQLGHPLPHLCLDGFTEEDGVYRGGMPEGESLRVEFEGPGFFGPRTYATREGPWWWNVEFEEAAQVLVQAQDPSGAPAPNAAVWVYLPRGSMDRLELDARGHCRGSGLANTVRFAMRLPRPDLPFEPWKQSRGISDVEVVVDLAPGEDRVVVLRPPEPSSALECHVLTEEGKPAAGTPLWLARDDSEYSDLEQLEVSVDTDGIARFGSLPPGRYGIGEQEIQRGRSRWKIDLAPSEKKTLDLTVDRRTPVMGVVRERSGKPAAHAQISAFDWGPSGYGVFRRSRCDEEGRFELGPIRPGPFHLSVFHGRNDGPRDLGVVNDGRPLEITLAEGPPPIVVRGSIAAASRTKAGGEIDAIIVVGGDESTGTAPVETAKSVGGRTVIEAYSRGFGFVKADGTFSVEIGALSPGTDHMEGKLCLRVGECEPIMRIMPPAARELDLGELTLQDGVTLRGRVEDAERFLARGGQTDVRAQVPVFGECLRAKVEPDGTFVLRGVPAGPITVLVRLFPPFTTRERHYYEGRAQVDPATVPGGDLGVIKVERVERKDLFP
ncbi:MAG: collagen binding domain-containing protein [Planctomycetota bacterium]